MAITATAAVLRGLHQEFTLEEVALDDPRRDEVVVRIVASGVCGTDLGVAAGHIPFPLPGVLGHEGAGIVEEVGSAVTRVRPGDHVLLTFTSCGECPNCTASHPAYCVDFLGRNLLGGERSDGSATIRQGESVLHGHFFAQSSFATRVLADERGLTKVDPDVDLTLLAPLGCGIQTGAGAVLNVLRPRPGSTLAIFGAGAVGLAAVMAGALSPATRIVVVDRARTRLDLALELGATDVIDASSTDPTEALRELTGGFGVTHALECTGSADVLRTAVEALAPLGEVGVMGAPSPGTTVPVDVNFLLNGRRITGITEGDSNPPLFLPALVDLVRQGRMPLDKIVTHYDFVDINTAADDARAAAVVKPVLRMPDLS